MNSYLWCQSNDSTSKDVYVINGVLSFDEQTNEQQRIARKFFECYEWGMLNKSSIQKLKRTNRIFENAFISHKAGEGFFLSSNFLDKDVAGRHVVYQFYCDSNDLDMVIDELVKTSSMVGHECNLEELKAIKKAACERERTGNSADIHLMGRPLFWLGVGALALLAILVKTCGSNA